MKVFRSTTKLSISTWGVLKKSAINFNQHNAFKFSASLAYYTIFSLPPMLIIIISMAGLFLGREAVEGKIFGQINELVGNAAALQIEETIKNITLTGLSKVASIIGVITLIIGATGVFTEIQDSINTIWGLKAKPEKGLIKLVLTRIISFSMVISLGFLLMVSLVINTLLIELNQRLMVLFPNVTVYIFLILNYILTFGVISGLFAIIFKVLPDAHIKWKDVSMGAMTTAVLFILGKFLISLYLGQSSLSTAYGAAGSIIILLVWVYYSSIILYFGAEFTHVYAYKYGSKIRPNNYAVWIVHQEVEKPTQPLDTIVKKTS